MTVRESVVRARIAKRAAETGRGVPEKLIKALENGMFHRLRESIGQDSFLAQLMDTRNALDSSAVESLREAVRLGPRNANIRYALATLLHQNGYATRPQAVPVCREVLALNPDHAGALRLLQLMEDPSHPFYAYAKHGDAAEKTTEKKSKSKKKKKKSKKKK